MRGESQNQAGGSISAAKLIEMGSKRGGQNYICITTMQNRELLFKYRIFLGFSTLEELLHRWLALMYHSVRVGVNIGSFSGAGTDTCRNASLQQSEVPELVKKKKKKKALQRKSQKSHSLQWQRSEKQRLSFTQQRVQTCKFDSTSP